jgi:hypothetical protein
MNGLLAFDGLLWLAVTVVVFVFLQRALHREIQAAFLILTRKPGLTQTVFAIIFFPGVVLHETSHFIVAKIVGVSTGRFSLIPQAQPDGKLRLGFVETGTGGFIRDALIGAAPLITGCTFVALSAIYLLHLMPLWDFIRVGDWSGFWAGLAQIPRGSDFWLWFYLTFTISSTMMPSASDRHAWLPLGLVALALVIVALVAGAGPWMLQNLAPDFNNILRALAMIFGLSGVLHVLLILPFMLIHRIMSKVTGIDVE